MGLRVMTEVSNFVSQIRAFEWLLVPEDRVFGLFDPCGCRDTLYYSRNYSILGLQDFLQPLWGRLRDMGCAGFRV